MVDLMMRHGPRTGNKFLLAKDKTADVLYVCSAIRPFHFVWLIVSKNDYLS